LGDAARKFGGFIILKQHKGKKMNEYFKGISGFELRAWDIKEGKMIDWGDNDLAPCRFVYDGSLDEMFDNASEEVIFMQTVGRRYGDTDEKIFEGDIVRYGDDEKYLFVISYVNEDCQYRAVGIYGTASESSIGYRICDNLVKVGNVFENRELFEK